MKGSGIQDLVKVKLEEYTPFGDSETGGPIVTGGDSMSEMKPIYAYIEKTIEQAANEVLRALPIHRLQYTTINNVEATEDSNDGKIGYIQLPTNFLRLHTLKMADWERPVHEVVVPDDPMFNRQYNKALRGNVCKPVAYMDNNVETSDLRLHYCSVDDSHAIESLLYVKKYDKEDDVTEYNNDVAEAIAINCARKICEIFGMNESMGFFDNELKTLIANLSM